MVLDLSASHGSTLVDARDGTAYLDLFTFFASSALGMNHPALVQDPVFREDLLAAAMNKPSNSDVYSAAMASLRRHLRAGARRPAPAHLFFVEGGASRSRTPSRSPSTEVALERGARPRPALGHEGAHLRRRLPRPQRLHDVAHHTDPVEGRPLPAVRLAAHPVAVPVSTPTSCSASARPLAAARAAVRAHPHDIAASSWSRSRARAATTTSGPSSCRRCRRLCREHDALFVLDEVQSGCGLTGTAWAFQQLGVQPDVVAFGKKTQVCGVMAGGRVDEVPDNVFAVGSRINSTWGGSLTDMVRARRILEVVEAEGLIAAAAALEPVCSACCATSPPATRRSPTSAAAGSMCAFSLPTPGLRDASSPPCATMSGCSCSAAAPAASASVPALTVSRRGPAAGVAALDRVLTRLTTSAQKGASA
jgi:L-lysine 6-transaminase